MSDPREDRHRHPRRRGHREALRHDVQRPVKIKVGPLSMTYKGQVELIERDDVNHVAVIKGKALEKAARARPTAPRRSRSPRRRLDEGEPQGRHRLSGRVAAMGKGVIDSVTKQMEPIVVQNIETLIAGGDTSGNAEAPGGRSTASRSRGASSARCSTATRRTATASHARRPRHAAEAWRSGETAGLCTVVRTFKSAPRDPGAAMLVTLGGATAGSVSGGCVEGAVYELANEAIGGASPVLERYGISDGRRIRGRPHSGGILDVFVEPINRETFPELGPSPTTSRRVVRRRRDGDRARRSVAGRSTSRGLAGPCLRHARRRARRPCRRRRGPRTARAGREPHAPLRAGGRAPRRGDAGLREQLRPGARGSSCSGPSTSPPRSRPSAGSSAIT